MTTRRMFLAALVMVTAAVMDQATNAWSAPRDSMNVQVRVYRSPRPGFYKFLPGVSVRLNNGASGITSNRAGETGCCFFRNLPKSKYTAEALIGGRWYKTTSIQWFGTTQRINIQIP